MSVNIIELLCAVLLMGGGMALLFKRLGLPVIPGYILAGFLLSPKWPHFSVTFRSDSPEVRTLSEFGVLLLMFSVGLHFGFRRLKAVGARPFLVGLAECLSVGAVAFGVGRALGFSWVQSLFTGALFAVSSTTVILKTMDDFSLHGERFAESVMGILIVEDIVAIVMLVILSSLALPGETRSLVNVLVALVVAICGWWFIGSLVTPRLVQAASRYGGSELLVILCVGLCLGLAMLFEALHLSAALGAFLTGAILADTRQIRDIRKSVTPLADVFVALFFVSIGLRLDPAQLLSNASNIGVFYAVLVISKVGFVMLYSLLAGVRPRESLKTALILTPIGEFSLVIADLGARAKAVDANLGATVIGVSVLSIFTAPLLLRVSDVLHDTFEKFVPAGVHRALMAHSDGMNAISLPVALPLVDANLPKRMAGAIKTFFGHLRINFRRAAPNTTTATLDRLAPWDEYLVETEVADNALVEHRSIRELSLRERLGISVVAVERAGVVHMPPEPDFRLFSGDVILLYGDQRHIAEALPIFERSRSDAVHTALQGAVPTLQDVSLRTVRLGENHPFVGLNLVDLDLRRKFESLILAVGRKGERIKNPSSQFRLQAGDELHVVGPRKRLREFATGRGAAVTQGAATGATPQAAAAEARHDV